MSEIIVLKMPDTLNSQEYQLFMSKVSSEKRQQLLRYVRKEDTYRSLLGEILVRATVCRHTPLTNEEIYFTRNPYGKPALSDYDRFSFNISHSGQWIVLIWGDQSVGIDVEMIKPVDLNIVSRYFSPQENNDFQLLSMDERLAYFYDLWTLKESYIKTVGKGLSMPLNSFTMRLSTDGTWIISPNSDDYFFKQYSIHPNYRLSACSSSDNLPENVNIAELDSLYDFINLARGSY